MAEIIERSARRYGVRTLLNEVDLEAATASRNHEGGICEYARTSWYLLSPRTLERQWVLGQAGRSMDPGPASSRSPKCGAEKFPDIIDHDKSYELNDFGRYVSERIRRAKAKEAKK
jgi:hypothetical protein